jgi:hypothetical protein
MVGDIIADSRATSPGIRISPTIAVNSLKFYVCSIVPCHHGCMSDEHSFSLRRGSTEYRELAGKLRELARVCIFPGPRRSLLRLAISFDGRATHFDCEAARKGAP